MKKRLFLLNLLACMLSSCYFLDDIFDPPKGKEPSLQEQSQETVEKYLKRTTGETYEPLGFGALTIHKPVEITDLEKLEKRFKINPSVELDSLIAGQKKHIALNNIERTLDLDHFFTLKDSNETLKVFETNFVLNDTLGVKNVSAKIMFRLPNIYEDVLTHYFFEYNIFNAPSYYESRSLSAQFYAFFKTELEKRKSLEEKSEFLLHVIKLTHEVKKLGEFRPQGILKQNVDEYMRIERPDIIEYQGLAFSKLYQTQEEGQTDASGYYFFHKFTGTYEGVLDTNVILVEFSPFYEIDNIFQMDRPFETYFK